MPLLKMGIDITCYSQEYLNCWNTYGRYIFQYFFETTMNCSLFIWFLLVQENLKPLVIYVIESFSDQLMNFEHFGSIQAFKLKYQQVGPFLVYSCIVYPVSHRCVWKKKCCRCTKSPQMCTKYLNLKTSHGLIEISIFEFFLLCGVVKSGQNHYGVDNQRA